MTEESRASVANPFIGFHWSIRATTGPACVHDMAHALSNDTEGVCHPTERGAPPEVDVAATRSNSFEGEHPPPQSEMRN